MTKTKLFHALKQATPPFIFSLAKKNRHYGSFKKWVGKLSGAEYHPQWSTASAGLLKGRPLFFDPKGKWQSEMLDGSFDKFIFDYLKNIQLEGKTIYDIGTHIGFHSLSFAVIVGEKGSVISFEPNPFNIERFKAILAKNTDLAQRIKLCEAAVSNNNGQEEFFFSDNVEGGASSGGFIDSAETPWGRGVYSEFKEMPVKTIRLDDLEAEMGIKEKPAVMKIDVEGAEGLVLAGGREILKNYGPVILMEVHSTINMYYIMDILKDLNYAIDVLQEENDGRCFVVAKPTEQD